jgi:hypothetical protein
MCLQGGSGFEKKVAPRRRKAALSPIFRTSFRPGTNVRIFEIFSTKKYGAIFAGKNDHNNSFQENVQIFLPKKQIKTTTPKVDFII